MIINLVYSSLVYIGWLKKVAFFFWNAIEFQAPNPHPPPPPPQHAH